MVVSDVMVVRHAAPHGCSLWLFQHVAGTRSCQCVACVAPLRMHETIDFWLTLGPHHTLQMACGEVASAYEKPLEPAPRPTEQQNGSTHAAAQPPLAGGTAEAAAAAHAGRSDAARTAQLQMMQQDAECSQLAAGLDQEERMLKLLQTVRCSAFRRPVLTLQQQWRGSPVHGWLQRLRHQHGSSTSRKCLSAGAAQPPGRLWPPLCAQCPQEQQGRGQRKQPPRLLCSAPGIPRGAPALPNGAAWLLGRLQ